LLFNDETKPVEGAPPAVVIRPWVVSADFLIARALYETDIRNLGKTIPGSDGVGALQVTVAEWKDFTANGGVLASDARASDRDHSVLQIPGAAWRQHVHGKAMSKIRLDAGKATAEDPFIPSFLDMFFAHVTNSPAAALAILDAQEAGTAPDTSIKEVLKAVMTAEELSALFKAREKVSGLPAVFFGTEANPSTLKTVVDTAEDTLKKLLVAALGRIEKHRPEMIPVVTAGGAPWMAVAEKAETDGVKEGTHNAEISGYFKHTDFGGNPNTNPPPAWCGAFAAHCMKGCDNPIIKASVPKEAAAAISWRSWGANFPLQSATIPRGAVVVLSLEPGATSGTGHVGFFLEFSPDKKKVFLLGGNQSRKVGKTPFPAGRIAEVRWLDQPGAVGAVAIDGITLPPSVAAGNRQFAGLILKAFAAAGYGRHQQIAALANAIGESNLNPRAHNTQGEDSVGLFQLNRRGGVGTGHTVERLMDPAFNTDRIIAEANRFPTFKNATTLREAVDVFVRKVERPADKPGQSAKRFKIAQALIA
ncbi:MAG TPA: phage tail tip lysozyme, partial [Phycisphaerae bacterium]|nr:phage tail tip lysozyme [Phycisphaerae bacterium]